MKLFVNLFLVRLYTRINIFKISFDFIEKRFGVVLKELLKFLSDMSLTSGIFADTVKIAGVTPVLKFDKLEENGVYSYQFFLVFGK